MSPKLLKVLHIGVSNRGEWPLAKCNESTGFTPAALCDVSVAALEKARATTGLPESVCFTNVDVALADARQKLGVDCVMICAPTVLHVPLCKKAIAAGLPVLVEKGMASDWASATELVQFAAEKKVAAAVAQNYRYAPVERTIWRAMHDPFASVWDMSCHHFDNLLYWLGHLDQMTAFSWGANWSAYTHHNNTSAHLIFKNQVRCHYIHTHDAARSSLEVQIHGERYAGY